MPVYHIQGIDVEFPHEAYPCQVTYMEKVILALQRKENALLESPTGTGKTLCLLCATLAWRQSFAQAKQGKSKGPFATGVGGAGGVHGAPGAAAGGAFDSEPVPQIIYSSRTHSQLAQVIRELRNTSYRVRTTVLASRQQMCLHPQVSKMPAAAGNFACRGLTKHKQCQWHNKQRIEQVQGQLMAPDAAITPPDIEDLLKVGSTVGVCPYFLSRGMVVDADLVFVPYNYLLEAQARSTLDTLRWPNAVVIFDEAHNVNEVCARSASFDLTAQKRAAAIAELQSAVQLVEKRLAGRGPGLLTGGDEDPSGVDLPDLLAQLRMAETVFVALDVRLHEMRLPPEGRVQRGEELFALLGSVNLTPGHWPLMADLLKRAADLLSDEELANSRTVGARAVATGIHAVLEALTTAFGTLEPLHARGPPAHRGYRLYLHNERQQAYGNLVEAPTLSYWCFLPGVAMYRLWALKVRSVLLTSGTLAPLESMAHELQLPFDHLLENPHIVADDQVWFGLVPTGPTGVALNSSYASRSSEGYRSDLGAAIANFARVVPDGLLVFFPSYGVMADSIAAWKQAVAGGGATLWDRICGHKAPVVEPRDSALFASAIEEYRRKLDDPRGGGAVLFAVCRGKVSEGLDFTDRAGRGVVLTGIPFAATKEAAVRIQRQVLDEEARAGGPGGARGKGLTGEQWYVQQAARAVNQAMGRVIRHRFDYGAILLCDERFAAPQNQRQLSKWLRERLVAYASFGQAICSLTHFFKGKADFKPPPGHRSASSGPAPPARLHAFDVVSRTEGGRGGARGGAGLDGGGGGQLVVPRAVDVSGFASVGDAPAPAGAAAGAAPKQPLARAQARAEAGGGSGSLDGALQALGSRGGSGSGCRAAAGGVGVGGAASALPIAAAGGGAAAAAPPRKAHIALGGGGGGSCLGFGSQVLGRGALGGGGGASGTVAAGLPALASVQQHCARPAAGAGGATAAAIGGKASGGGLRMGAFLRSWDSTQVEQQQQQKGQQQQGGEHRQQGQAQPGEQRQRGQQRGQAAGDAGADVPTTTAATALATGREGRRPPQGGGGSPEGAADVSGSNQLGAAEDPAASAAAAAALRTAPPEQAGDAPAAGTREQPSAAAEEGAAAKTDAASFLARLQAGLAPETMAAVKALLGQYRKDRDRTAFMEAILQLLKPAPTAHLLGGFAAFLPSNDRHWFSNVLAAHFGAGAAQQAPPSAGEAGAAAASAKRGAFSQGAGGNSGTGRGPAHTPATPAKRLKAEGGVGGVQSHTQSDCVRASHSAGGVANSSAGSVPLKQLPGALELLQQRKQLQQQQRRPQPRPLGAAQLGGPLPVPQGSGAAPHRSVPAAGEGAAARHAAAMGPRPASTRTPATGANSVPRSLPSSSKAASGAGPPASRRQPCAVCSKLPMEGPHRAACGHMACYACWLKLLAANLRQALCPKCSKDVRRAQLKACYFV